MNKWIKDCVFYQIYPTSFYDGNGDGIGDLKGITQKLDYVASLGVKGIWFNPFYPSPFMDGGYDVADYCAVHPMFGTMADFEEMVEKCHSLGIKVVIDLVIGHTSVAHPWFKESAKDEKNKYTDWYIWTDIPIPPQTQRRDIPLLSYRLKYSKAIVSLPRLRRCPNYTRNL